jgi:hypothetical protein
MKTAAEYRKHAEECRALARQVPEGEQRNQLLEMARTWDNLAADRGRLVRNHPELDTRNGPTKAREPSNQWIAPGSLSNQPTRFTTPQLPLMRRGGEAKGPT